LFGSLRESTQEEYKVISYWLLKGIVDTIRPPLYGFLREIETFWNHLAIRIYWVHICHFTSSLVVQRVCYFYEWVFLTAEESFQKENNHIHIKYTETTDIVDKMKQTVKIYNDKMPPIQLCGFLYKMP
jgi:hypothetical protein